MTTRGRLRQRMRTEISERMPMHRASTSNDAYCSRHLLVRAPSIVSLRCIACATMSSGLRKRFHAMQCKLDFTAALMHPHGPLPACLRRRRMSDGNIAAMRCDAVCCRSYVRDGIRIAQLDCDSIGQTICSFFRHSQILRPAIRMNDAIPSCTPRGDIAQHQNMLRQASSRRLL